MAPEKKASPRLLRCQQPSGPAAAVNCLRVWYGPSPSRGVAFSYPALSQIRTESNFSDLIFDDER
jgi:hypothetical protein